MWYRFFVSARGFIHFEGVNLFSFCTEKPFHPREHFFFRFEGDSAAAYLNRLYCYWNQITFARIRNSITYKKWVVFANTSCATQFNIITCYLLVWRLYRKLNDIWIVYLELICSLACNHIEMIESQSVFLTMEKDLII